MRTGYDAPAAAWFLAFTFVYGATAAYQDWPTYGGDAGGTRYSPLKQITRENVSKLKAAWTYQTGALQPESRRNRKAAGEAQKSG